VEVFEEFRVRLLGESLIEQPDHGGLVDIARQAFWKVREM
jgi:hypothetical protein